jgi:hypothetical protein
MQLTEAAQGEQVHFFRTVKKGSMEIKIYFTNTRLITAKFNRRNLVELQHRVRPHSESLLGIESNLQQELIEEVLLS